MADLDPDLERAIAGIRADLADEYHKPHDDPWIVGFSGGKDNSTLVAHLVFELLLDLPPAERRRRVHVVANDTLVESPLVMAHIRRVQEEMRAAVEAWRLPVEVVTTRPSPDHTFWVNLIGRGYPTPNRTFRWCTDRMKIQPTSRYIKEQVAASGEVVLLLGVRRDESATRAGSVARYDNGARLNRHNDLPGCMVYRPILELSTEAVWEFLATVPPPWGGSHQALIQLYRDAGGGECPVVTQKSDVPSCGTTSSRFGCWTCTVVEKDRSLEGFVEADLGRIARGSTPQVDKGGRPLGFLCQEPTPAHSGTRWSRQSRSRCRSMASITRPSSIVRWSSLAFTSLSKGSSSIASVVRASSSKRRDSARCASLR